MPSITSYNINVSNPVNNSTSFVVSGPIGMESQFRVRFSPTSKPHFEQESRGGIWSHLTGSVAHRESVQALTELIMAHPVIGALAREFQTEDQDTEA